MTRYVVLDRDVAQQRKSFTISQANRYLEGRTVMIDFRSNDSIKQPSVDQATSVWISRDSTFWRSANTQRLNGAPNEVVSTITVSSRSTGPEGALVGGIAGLAGSLLYVNHRINSAESTPYLTGEVVLVVILPLVVIAGVLGGALLGSSVGTEFEGGSTVLVYPDEAGSEWWDGILRLFRKDSRAETRFID
jgi:hypothetical protein